MNEPKWKLGEDMSESDTVLDPITFDQIILAVRHNSSEVGEQQIAEVAADIIRQRLEDYWYIVKNNTAEIIEAVQRMKNGG